MLTKETLRYMLLPVHPEKEGQALEQAEKILKDAGIEENEYDKFLQINYESWRAGEKIDPILKQTIIQILLTTKEETTIDYSDKYFDLHFSLISQPFISFDTTVILLSHLRVIINLAIKEKMSSVKIRNVLGSMDSRLNIISWKDVQFILRTLKIEPELLQQNVDTLYNYEEAVEETHFADADLKEAADLVGEVAKKLLFPKDLSSLLKKLIQKDSSHLPYLQILQYQCIITPFYDHVFTALYEFNPRGNIANSIFAKWDNLVATGNPILNNAKAVDILSESWANSRKPAEYEAAHVLVTILENLNGMGIAAARELSMWIRLFILRYIRVQRTEPKILKHVDADAMKKIIMHISENPTNTFGIVEQRLVDVVSSFLHSKTNGWRPRGVGDSVNSNNLSKKKLGDSDFQNSGATEIVAYEAHGGILSPIYVEGHLRTLRRAFSVRKEELEGIAELNQWKMKVIFVAFGFKNRLPDLLTFDNVVFSFEYRTFSDLLARCELDNSDFLELFNLLFIDVINDRRTPELVRDRIREYL